MPRLSLPVALPLSSGRPTPGAVARGLGAGRVVLGVAFMAAPVVSVRVLGVDTATAKRITFLARMAAARDIGLGAGVLATAPAGPAAPWLIAGAVADAVDAVAIGTAMRAGTARGIPAAGIVVGAALSAAAGVWAARGLRVR